MSTFPAPNPLDQMVVIHEGQPAVRLHDYQHLIYGLDDDWNATDDGDWTCYSMAPDEVPAAQVARVIYELRCDIGRLNTEVMDAVATIRTQREV